MRDTLRVPRRPSVVAGLKGQEFQLPDLENCLESWPAGVNAHLHALRAEVQTRLECIVEQVWGTKMGSKKLKVLAKANFGLFGARWWPWASFATLRIMTFVAIWLFLWDDEIDAEIGDLANDFEAAQRYRAETLTFLQRSLGLADGEIWHPNYLVQSFDKPIGTELRLSCTKAQRGHIYGEMVTYINASEVEQRRRLRDEGLPSVKDYWECRIGTSAVGLCVALLEYGHNLSPVDDESRKGCLQVLYDTTNIIVSITNDIISLKKELAQNTVDSLLPLIWLEGHDLQSAMDSATKTLLLAKKEFEVTAKYMLGACSSLPYCSCHRNLRFFMDACRANCTGNLYWSLETGRYGLEIDDTRAHEIITL